MGDEGPSEASGTGGSKRSLRNRMIGGSNRTGAALLEELQTEYDSMDILQWEDDDIAVRMAAGISRLPYDRPTAQEMGAFPELSKDEATVDFYLYLRNKMLQMWHLQPNIELVIDDIVPQLPSPFDSDPRLIVRIYEFLQRFGYINVGIFAPSKAPLKPYRQRVIVIGAGIAGVAAARHLKYLGLNVTVLEARTRTGGRISTYLKPVNNPMDVENNRRNCIVAELGASFMYGTFENPLMTLCKQCDVMCFPVCLERCPIYEASGKVIERKRMLLIERAFHNLLYASTYLAHTKKITEVNGQKLSLGDTLAIMLKQQDYRLLRRRRNYFKTCEIILTKLKTLQQLAIVKKNELTKLHEQYNELKEKENRTDLTKEEQMENEIFLKCVIKDMNDAVKAFETYDQKRKEADGVLAEMTSTEPSSVYMNDLDKRLFDFHIANLELTVGAAIDDVSLQYWNHNADFGLQGPNMYIAEGLRTFVDVLSAGLDIKFGHVVEKIEYDHAGVRVTCLVGEEEKVFPGSYVLCTVPLGVLKRSVRGRDNAPKFIPPLPQCKIDAINALGFGNINKVVLIFKEAFWDKPQVFGHLSETLCSTNRGEIFMFQALTDKPVLIALISGDSANALEEAPSHLIVYKIMEFLTAVFGSVCPKEPVDVIITRWRSDPFARGAFSFVPPNCTPDVYDTLAKPIRDETPIKAARIFFAGEHTCRQHAGTIHGAYLSGLREAGRIADIAAATRFGCIHEDPTADIFEFVSTYVST